MTNASRLVFAMVASAAGIHASGARARQGLGVLMRIEPDTRLEQVCDVEAMRQIAKMSAFKPDRAKSDVILHPIHKGDSMSAPGAAFRSGGIWHAFAFECRGTPDHLRVLSLSLTIGEPIPKSRWKALDLWQ